MPGVGDFQDYHDELANGFHVMLETGVLVTVRWDPVGPLR